MIAKQQSAASDMMRARFKTSEGYVHLYVNQNDGSYLIDENNNDILERIYCLPYSPEHRIEPKNGDLWIFIDLDNPHFGFPEYPIELLP